MRESASPFTLAWIMTQILTELARGVQPYVDRKASLFEVRHFIATIALTNAHIALRALIFDFGIGTDPSQRPPYPAGQLRGLWRLQSSPEGHATQSLGRERSAESTSYAGRPPSSFRCDARH